MAGKTRVGNALRVEFVDFLRAFGHCAWEEGPHELSHNEPPLIYKNVANPIKESISMQPYQNMYICVYIYILYMYVRIMYM